MEGNARTQGEIVAVEAFGPHDWNRLVARLGSLLGAPTKRREQFYRSDIDLHTMQESLQWRWKPGAGDAAFLDALAAAAEGSHGKVPRDKLAAAVAEVRCSLTPPGSLPFAWLAMEVRLSPTATPLQDTQAGLFELSLPFRRLVEELGGLSRDPIIPRVPAILHVRIEGGMAALEQARAFLADRQGAPRPPWWPIHGEIASHLPAGGDAHVIVGGGHPGMPLSPKTLYAVTMAKETIDEGILGGIQTLPMAPFDLVWRGVGTLAPHLAVDAWLDTAVHETRRLDAEITRLLAEPWPRKRHLATLERLEGLVEKLRTFETDLAKADAAVARFLRDQLVSETWGVDPAPEVPPVYGERADELADGLLAFRAFSTRRRLDTLRQRVAELRVLLQDSLAGLSTRVTLRSTRAMERLTWLMAALTLATLALSGIQLWRAFAP